MLQTAMLLVLLCPLLTVVECQNSLQYEDYIVPRGSDGSETRLSTSKNPASLTEFTKISTEIIDHGNELIIVSKEIIDTFSKTFYSGWDLLWEIIDTFFFNVDDFFTSDITNATSSEKAPKIDRHDNFKFDLPKNPASTSSEKDKISHIGKNPASLAEFTNISNKIIDRSKDLIVVSKEIIDTFNDVWDAFSENILGHYIFEYMFSESNSTAIDYDNYDGENNLYTTDDYNDL